MSQPTILDVMRHPDGLGPFFKGGTWAAWESFLAALFALPMDDNTLALYRHHTGRVTAPTVPFEEAATVAGRRGGKSRILALIAVYLACFRNYAPHLAPGEAATIAVIAADRKQARSIFRYALGMLEALPSMKSLIKDQTADSIVLHNQVVLEITTASLRSTRGYSFAAVLVDEIAFLRTDETSANPDIEVLQAIRPGLASIPGSMLLLASSPYAKAGVLWETFRDYYGRDDADVLVFRGTTRELNSTIPQRVIDKAYERDPASAAAEHGAEFRSDLESYVSRAAAEACVEWGRHELSRMPNVRYTGFVDASSGSGSDQFTCAIGHREQDIAVLDLVRARKPPFSPQAVVAEYCDTLKLYGITSVCGDRYAGGIVAEMFEKQSIKYIPSERNRSEIYIDFLPMLNSGKVRLLDHPKMISELCALERRSSRGGGRDVVDHPARIGSDDIINSAAGALVLTLSERGPMVISDDMLARARARQGSRPLPIQPGRRFG